MEHCSWHFYDSSLFQIFFVVFVAVFFYLKHPNKSFFNPIHIFDIFYHSVLLLSILLFSFNVNIYFQSTKRSCVSAMDNVQQHSKQARSHWLCCSLVNHSYQHGVSMDLFCGSHNCWWRGTGWMVDSSRCYFHSVVYNITFKTGGVSRTVVCRMCSTVAVAVDVLAVCTVSTLFWIWQNGPLFFAFSTPNRFIFDDWIYTWSIAVLAFAGGHFRCSFIEGVVSHTTPQGTALVSYTMFLFL